MRKGAGREIGDMEGREMGRIMQIEGDDQQRTNPEGSITGGQALAEAVILPALGEEDGQDNAVNRP